MLDYIRLQMLVWDKHTSLLDSFVSSEAIEVLSMQSQLAPMLGAKSSMLFKRIYILLLFSYFSGHCYFASKNELSWISASAICAVKKFSDRTFSCLRPIDE